MKERERERDDKLVWERSAVAKLLVDIDGSKVVWLISTAVMWLRQDQLRTMGEGEVEVGVDGFWVSYKMFCMKIQA